MRVLIGQKPIGCNILALLSIVCVLPMQIIMSLRVERFAFSPFALTYTRLLAAVWFSFPNSYKHSILYCLFIQDHCSFRYLIILVEFL